MKVEILRSVMVSGEPAAVGSLLDLDDSTAHLLIGMGKAAVAAEAPAAPAEAEAEAEPAKPVRRPRITASATKD